MRSGRTSGTVRRLQRRNGPGDAGHAAELLAQALEVAVDLGLGAVERRARALLEVSP